MPQAFLIRTGSRRGLGDEGERAVSVNRDDNRNDHAGIVLGALVELLGESHDVDAVLAESRTYRGSRGCLACGNLELDISLLLSVPC